MPTDPSVTPSPADPGRTDITQRALLQSIVETARMVFGAMAASVLLLDRDTDDLVFEAVAGEGEEHLVGTRFPSGTGIAGWVVTSGLPLIVDDVAQSSQFSRDAAESTGYVPACIMAAPVIWGGECIGVLEVLDRGSRQRTDLADIDLLGLLATEMGMALELLIRLQWAQGRNPANQASAEQPYARLLQRLAERLPKASEPVASTVGKLLDMADQMLAEDAVSVGSAM